MLEGGLSEVGGECGVGQLSGECIEIVNVLLADLYLLFLLFIESAQLLCLLLCLLLRLLGRNYLRLLLHLVLSIIIQSMFGLTMMRVATLILIVGRVCLCKAEPFILVLFSEPAFFVALVEPDQPIVVTGCVVFLLPGQYLEHARLFISWDVVHSMPNGLFLRIKERRSLPHYSNNNNTIHHPISKTTFLSISILFKASNYYPFKI